jgi:hypothetical protein
MCLSIQLFEILYTSDVKCTLITIFMNIQLTDFHVKAYEKLIPPFQYMQYNFATMKTQPKSIFHL